jgi:hypothetical protein
MGPVESLIFRDDLLRFGFDPFGILFIGEMDRFVDLLVEPDGIGTISL